MKILQEIAEEILNLTSENN